MKKLIPVFLMIFLTFSFAACKTETSQLTTDTQDEAKITTDAIDQDKPESDKKILVAYFSATGTTERIAKYAAEAMDADIYEIIPELPYTSDDLDYNNKNSRTSKEMNDPSCRPAISGKAENMENYDIVFIGYPIWWGEAPRIISTFVESYDLSGKTVVTFSTSGSSGHNDSSIKSLANDVNWITGTRMNDRNSQSAVAEWINSLELDISVKK